MTKLTIFGVLSTVQIKLFTALHGTPVGVDSLGNKYYRRNPRRGQKRERRWVMYNGAVEAAQVPAEWHGWLHYQTDVVPAADSAFRKDWIKPHQPNLTGTNDRHLPAPLKGKPRAKATGDYIAWQPK